MEKTPKIIMESAERGEDIMWLWDFSSKEERDSVDNYLVSISHPLAFEAGTKEYRFRSIVKEIQCAKK